MIRVVCLSDTHNRQGQIPVPEGDLLIHAGDLTWRGTLPEVTAALDWIGSLPHSEKVVVAGNHDFLFEREPALARSLVRNASYLEGDSTRAAGLRIWGGPWQPWFQDWAFNLPRGAELATKWSAIPEGVDILVTHGPPWKILDRTLEGEHVGDEALADRIESMSEPPRLHVFGHIHESYGIQATERTTFVNAAICDRGYRAANPAVVIDLP